MRVLLAILLIAALLAAATVGVPTKTVDGTSRPDLPSIALGQESLYRLEIFLVVFYGGLLIATPAYRGLVSGRLPTEISARGAKFAEDAAGSIGETKKLVRELDERVTNGEAKAARVRLNIDQLADEAEVALRD